MDCPNCGSEGSERAAFCTQCGASLPKRPGRARSFFKWGGIGCGGLLGLFIVVVIVAALTTDTPSSDEQDTSAPQLCARDAVACNSDGYGSIVGG